MRSLKFLSYFWGPIPWMIEVGGDSLGLVGHWPDFWHHSSFAGLANAVIGFWEERQAGNAIDALKARLAIKTQGEARRKMGHPAGEGTRARRRHPAASRRHRPGGCAPAGRRRDLGRPIGADRGIIAGHAQIRRCRIFRFDHSSRRDRRPGLCDRRRKPTSARRRNWWRRRSPSAISRRPC